VALRSPARRIIKSPSKAKMHCLPAATEEYDM